MKLRSATILAMACLCLTRPAPVSAQLTSPSFKLDGQTSSGAASTSTSFAMYHEVGFAGARRSTSATFDLFSNFTPLAFSPVASLTYTTAAKVYKLVAFPLKRTNSTPTAVLNELGSYDDRVWRLGHFDTPNNVYQEPPSGLAAIQPGLGYWLITENAQSNLVDTGLPLAELPALGANDEFLLTPAATVGWYQMGNPWPYPIQVDNIWATDEFDTYLGGIVGATNTITSQVVKRWNSATSQYEDLGAGATINGREGFWIKKLTNARTVRLYFFRVASTSGTPSPAEVIGGRAVDLAAASAARNEGAAAPSWSLSLVARQGARASETVQVGAASVAAGAWNPLCVDVAPPPPGMELLSLRMPRRDWGHLSGDYTRVFEPQAESMSWDLVLSGVEAPGELTLDVGASDLPAGTRLTLTDVATGTVRALVPGRALTVPAYAGDRQYRLEASTAGTPAAVESAIATGFRQAYPNPFRTGTGLSFGLARGGDVTVELFDLQGRRVRSIERRGASAGDHVLVWDGRDDGGRALGSGVYLARWRAGDARGVSRLVKVE